MSSRPIIALLPIVLTTITVAGQSVDSLPAEPDNAVAQPPAPSTSFTEQERLRWLIRSTLGPKNLAAGVFVAGFQTWRNEPEAYGPHWNGFRERYGSRLAAGATSHAIEAGFGSLWGEDPRYFRAAEQPLAIRIGHVVKMAFVTHNRDGNAQLAYARFIAVPGGILVSNTWRPDSPTTLSRVSVQVGLGFLSRIAGNAFSEFIPDLRAHFKRHSPSASQGTR